MIAAAHVMPSPVMVSCHRAARPGSSAAARLSRRGRVADGDARRPRVGCAAVKGSSARSVCCSKTLVAKADTVDAVTELCERAVAFSRGRLGRASGVLEFTCARDSFEPHVLHFYEVYESTAAMGAHNTTPELRGFLEQVVPLLERPVGMALYETRDGKLGTVCMQSGPKGEGGLDDATGASGAAGGASYKQTSRMTEISSMVTGDKVEGSSIKTPEQQQQQQLQLQPLAPVLAAVAAAAGAVLVARMMSVAPMV